MMNRKITALSVAVAAALTLPLAQQASAATAMFAKELPASVLSSSAFKTQSVGFAPLSTNYTVGGVNFMYVAVTLGGGAKFANKANVQVVCLQSAGGVRASGVAGNAQSAASAAIFFAINTGLSLIGGTVSSFCRVTAPDGFYMGGSNANKTMTFETWRKVATTTAHTVSSNAFISFGKAGSASVISGSVAVPANDTVIDVATGSTKFKETTHVVTPTTAFVGEVRYNEPTYASNAPTFAVSADGATKVTLANLGGAAGFTVNVSGAPLAGAVKVYLAPAGGCGAATYSVVPAAGTQQASFTGVTPTNISAGMAVCVGHNGTSAISAGPLTAWLSKNPETTLWQYDFSASNNQLHELRKNGASFKL